MFRSLVLGLAALALVVGGIVDEEYKGKLAKVDASAKKITIETKDGADKSGILTAPLSYSRQNRRIIPSQS